VSQRSERTVTTTTDGPRVLVVDDDAQVRQAIRWALEDEGFTVVTVADASEALDAARNLRPAVVILDYTLPGIDGQELARQLRTGHVPSVPILMITADGEPAGKAARLGAYAFVQKPFQVEDLVSAVRRGLPEQHRGK
jgi:DNA-binding response OmpR family regulator